MNKYNVRGGRFGFVDNRKSKVTDRLKVGHVCNELLTWEYDEVKRRAQGQVMLTTHLIANGTYRMCKTQVLHIGKMVIC